MYVQRKTDPNSVVTCILSSGERAEASVLVVRSRIHNNNEASKRRPRRSSQDRQAGKAKALTSTPGLIEIKRVVSQLRRLSRGSAMVIVREHGA